MSNSIRIRTTPLGEDKHLKVKIDQDFDYLEILSLKLTQEDVYRRFCSDYGVIIGRVVVNGGFGIPNAKISVFIPIDEIDKLDKTISTLYPYESVNGKNGEGIRYNLLTNSYKENDPCFVPVGTMSSKREVLDCDVKLEVFEKYYKFTTTTNNSGDYMLFGVPVGSQTIHLDVDLSDIGSYSQKPYELISQGYNKKQFVSQTQFKKSNNLDGLSQIKSRNTSTSVIPLWGDTNNCEIGITRLDFDLNYNITPTAIVMGSIITDKFKNGVNKNCRPKVNVGEMSELVTSQGKIEIVRKSISGDVELFIPQGESTDINENGVYCFQIPMNLNTIITDEFGNEVPSEDPTVGIATSAKIRMRTSAGGTSNLSRKYRYAKHLTPNRTNNYNFGSDTPDDELAEIKAKKIYTTKQFISRYQKGSASNKNSRISIKKVDEDLGAGVNPFPYNRIDPEVNPLFSLFCLIMFVVIGIVVLLNGIVFPVINLVIGILNFILPIICLILFYIGIITILIITLISLIVDVLNFLGAGLNPVPVPAPCDFCIVDSCSGWSCNCCEKPILPFVPCIVLTCNNERYAPGCSPTCCAFGSTAQCNPNCVQSVAWGIYQGYCASGQLDHWGPFPVANTQQCCSCNHNVTGTQCANSNNLGHSLGNYYGYFDCLQSQLANAFSLYRFDFYNDYINGVLYFFTFKYKSKAKKSGQIEVFCDYDCHDDFETDSDGPEHQRNDCSNRSNLVETCVDQGAGSLANNEISEPIKEGLIKHFDGEKYYPGYTHNKVYIMYASDFLCLGSTIDCDVDGSLKIIEQLESTSYQVPELSNQTVDDAGNVVEEMGADPLLYNIRCLFPQCYVTARNCANIRKICEIGIGIDELREDYNYNPDGSLNSVITTNADCIIDPCNSNNNYLDAGYDVEDYDVRTELAYCNGVPRSVTNCGNIYTQYTGYVNGFLEPNIANEYFGDIRFLNNRPKNSYYFYFGMYEGKTALNCVIENYFTPCVDVNPNKKIAINVNVTNNQCTNDNTGQIKIKIINGLAPWSYSVVGTQNTTPITPGTTSSDLLIFNNLLSGQYTVTVSDSNSVSSSYTITVNDPPNLYVSAVVQPTSSPTTNDGVISLIVLNGNPPYTYTWTPPVPGGQNGPLITGLNSGQYSVTVTDTPLLGCSQQTFTITGITLQQPSGLSFVVNKSLDDSGNYNIGCRGDNTGQIIISNVSGGTAPYTYYVNGQNIGTTTISDLVAGNYTITIYDSNSGQSSTQIVQLTQPNPITATVVGNTQTECYNCVTTISITNVQGGVGGYTYSWNTTNSSQNSNQTVNVGAGTYTWYVYDTNGCSTSGTTTVTQPSKLEINNIIVQDALCYNGNGTTTFDVNGGTTPRQYRIFTSVPGVSYVQNASNCTLATNNANFLGNTSSCLSGINGLTPIVNWTPVTTSGSFTTPVTNTDQYYIEVKDTNGCTSCRTFIMTSPTQLSLTLSTIPKGGGYYDILCIASGGYTPTGNYTYQLYNNLNCTGSLLVTSLDAGSHLFTSAPGYLSGFNPGNYGVKITDTNNCTKCVNLIIP